jgi:hypothetical protein
MDEEKTKPTIEEFFERAYRGEDVLPKQESKHSFLPENTKALYKRSRDSPSLLVFISNDAVNKLDVLGLFSFSLSDWSSLGFATDDNFQAERDAIPVWPAGGDPHGGDFRHCRATCRLTRRTGPGIAAAVIQGWNELNEGDDPNSIGDIAANWCGYRQAIKLSESCDELCKCNCLKRPL